ncbi:hypothetical protein AB0E85_18295 [Streptomyces sp. NPDC029044]|uniref:hypothetical protein n=1 Tax=Streptomyces sp. NPDC029044 TaxID=3157198 RepID=UPI0033DDCC03
MLNEVCPPGVDVARYLNYHEDSGGLSLALGRSAIASVQRIAVPLPDTRDDGWVRDAVAALEGASDTAVPATGKPALCMRPPSARAVLGRQLGASLADRLPVNRRNQFRSAAVFAEREDPERWARRTSGLFDLIDDPTSVLAALDQQDPRSENGLSRFGGAGSPEVAASLSGGRRPEWGEREQLNRRGASLWR